METIAFLHITLKSRSQTSRQTQWQHKNKNYDSTVRKSKKSGYDFKAGVEFKARELSENFTAT